METVDVLGGVDQLQGPLGVQVRRQRQLHDETRTRRVCVERGDALLEEVLVDVSGVMLADGGDADLRAVAVLACDVGLAARVVTDQHGAEPGGDPLLGEARDS